MQFATWEEARKKKRRVTTADGLNSGVSTFIGVPASENAAHPPLGTLFPVAFRVDQDPHTKADPHFHQADQFQVFVEGDGSFGRRPVRAAHVQFAQAYTPYGPIVAGDHGLSYLTLRNGWDPGGQFMPAQRELLRASGRRPRAVMSAPIDATPEAALVSRREIASESVLPDSADGLGAWRHRIPPGRSVFGPAPSSGAGQCWIVLSGVDVSLGEPLPACACAFVAPDEPPRTVTAGEGGLDVLVLQFPRRDATPAS
jgi:hypothetical protein